MAFKLPVLIFTAVPSTKLVAAEARVMAPAPLLVMVRAVVPSFKAPSVSSVPDAGVNVALPVKVVAPKVNPAVPLETLAPEASDKVFAPMFNVPHVCVMPAPLAARLELIVTLPPTVVL